MLVANRRNGEKFSLADYHDRNELLDYRKREEFQCPVCGEIVILKLGSKRIWHFSHRKDANCPQEYERESDYHMKGKLQLFHWLKQKGLEVVLENYIPSCRQRADIAIEWQDKKYALEFQCSSISPELFMKRTEGYIESGIIPIWLLGGNQLKRMGANLYSFNLFQYLFLRKTVNGWNIPSYCPDFHSFIFLHHPLSVSSKKVMASMAAYPRSETNPSILFTPSPVKLLPLSNWLHELQKVKNGFFIHPTLEQRIFLNELYKKKLNLLLLPPEIGVPVPSAPFIETPPLVWQTYLYLDILRHIRKGEVFTEKNLYHAILIRTHKKQITLRSIPLLKQGDFFTPVKEYLHLLVKISTLEKISENRYKMVRPFYQPSTVEHQAYAEKSFYRKFEAIIMNQF